MKKVILLLCILILFNCESKESFRQEIVLLELELEDLKRSQGLVSYINEREMLKNEKSLLNYWKKELDIAISNSDTIKIATLEPNIKRTDKRVDSLEAIVEYFKPTYDTIKIKQNRIKLLEKKLNH